MTADLWRAKFSVKRGEQLSPLFTKASHQFWELRSFADPASEAERERAAETTAGLAAGGSLLLTCNYDHNRRREIKETETATQALTTRVIRFVHSPMKIS
jgi:hypothetical protein